MDNFKIALKNKNFDHCYFFLGEEVFLTNFYLDALKKALGCNEDFDYIVVDEEDVLSLQEIVEAAPVLSEKKLVVLKGIDLSLNIKSDAVDFLEQLLENVPPYTCLVFTSITIKKNSKIYKLLNDKCKVTLFERQKPQDVIKWILKAAQTKNVMIDRETAALLIEFAGVDMTTLNAELDKLASFCGEGNVITADAIERVVIKSIDAKIYYLLDAVFGGNSREAFELLKEYEVENETPIYINASIMGTIRTILEYDCLLKEGKTAYAISEKLKLRPIQAKKYAGYVKKISSVFLEAMLKRCVELDIQLKRGIDGFSALSLIIGEMLLKTKK